MAEKVLQIVYKCIESGDINNIQKFFTKVDTKIMSESNSLSFLNSILIYCDILKPKKVILDCILQNWISNYEFLDIYEIFGLIYSYPIFDEKVLIYLFSEYHEMNTYDLVKTLISRGLFMNQIITIFDNFENYSKNKILRGQVLNILDLAVKNTYGDGNTDVVEYFKKIVTDSSEYSKIPEYVDEMKYEKEIDPKYFEIGEWTNSTINNPIYNLNYEDIENKIKHENELLKVPENLELKEIIKIGISMGDNFQELDLPNGFYITANRIFGPRNSFENQECQWSIKGGCRMLTCMCHEEIENEDTNFDWFDGSCDGCMNHIKNKSHCLRYPCKNGGWKGTYCGMACMSTNNREEIDEYTEIRFDRIEEIIGEYGIYDRS